MMNRTLQTIRYLIGSLKWMVSTGILVMIGTVVLTDYIFYRSGGFDLSKSAAPGTIELTAGVFSVLIGLLYFRHNFRVALANGISRKTFMLANLPAAALAAFIFAVASQSIMALHNLFWPISSMVKALYPSIVNWLWSVFFQTVLFFMLINIGWFTTFIYYRANTVAKWIITLTICFIFFLPMIAPQDYYMSIAPAIHDFLMWCLHGLIRAPIMMLIFSAVLFELTFLLIHRAPLKD